MTVTTLLIVLAVLAYLALGTPIIRAWVRNERWAFEHDDTDTVLTPLGIAIVWVLWAPAALWALASGSARGIGRIWSQR